MTFAMAAARTLPELFASRLLLGVTGVINAARIGASFLGPVIATSLLAAGSPVLLYVALSLIGLACVPLSAMRAHVAAVPR